MTDGVVVGVKPWLPAPFCHWGWWTAPVRAERLAALRIGVGLVLMLDILGTYLPRADDFFGSNGLSRPGAFDWKRGGLQGEKKLFERFPGAGLLWVWAGSALLLALGVLPRASALVAWLLSMGAIQINNALHNSGDQVRTILLFYLILTPSGAVWSLQGFAKESPPRQPVLIHPWAFRLLFIQLAVIYFMNGLFKLKGSHWHSGQALQLVLGDAAWTRWSFADWPLPGWLLQCASWVVLVWELAFPVCMFLPRCRKPALWMGVAFHVGTGATMRLGAFPLYMLCLYLPLLPWEKFPTSLGRS